MHSSQYLLGRMVSSKPVFPIICFSFIIYLIIAIPFVWHSILVPKAIHVLPLQG